MDTSPEKDRIKEMIETIMKVARGDYSVQIKVSEKNDDLDSLAMGLNMMIDDIGEILRLQQAAEKSKITALEQARAELEKKVTERTAELKNTYLASLNIMEDMDRRGKELEKAYNELKSTQEQLIQAEKMSSLGLMAGGIAHELNNPLTHILGFSQLMLNETDKSSQQYEDLKDIVTSALRCKDIISELLTYARQEKSEFKPVKINGTIEAAVVLMRHRIYHSKIKIIKNLSPGLPVIYGNTQQLEQVFINMMTNASDAMPQGGNLTVTTAVQNGMVEISFADTGVGIPDEIVRKIFDPFFTTKPVGKGTGLGLSICIGIIDKHKGRINVKSTPGGGSTFTIALPLTESGKE